MFIPYTQMSHPTSKKTTYFHLSVALKFIRSFLCYLCGFNFSSLPPVQCIYTYLKNSGPKCYQRMEKIYS